MRKHNPRSGHKAAEMLAIGALGFLADEPERIGRFLALSGIEPAEIRACANDPRFLAAVLEHFLGDEVLLLAFATQAGLDPSEVAQAHTALGGGAWERDTA